MKISLPQARVMNTINKDFYVSSQIGTFPIPTVQVVSSHIFVKFDALIFSINFS